MVAISGWDNFYVIVGSAAGALIGLQFVRKLWFLIDSQLSAG